MLGRYAALGRGRAAGGSGDVFVMVVSGAAGAALSSAM
jgi:hypothetical protein